MSMNFDTNVIISNHYLQSPQYKVIASEDNATYKNIRLVCGVARYIDGAWALIINEGHDCVNCSIPTGQTSETEFRLNHAIGATKVLSLVCGPDETYMAQGVRCGASVGLDYSIIKISWPATAVSLVRNNQGITYGHEAYHSNKDCISLIEKKDHATLGNYLKISYQTDASFAGITTIDSTTDIDWRVLGVGNDYINLQPYNKSGQIQTLPLATGLMNFTLSKLLQNGIAYQSIDHTAANIWFTGVFEVA